MIYKDEQHKKLYNNLCGQFKHIDEFHAALLYLIALDEVCRQHIPAIFSIEQDCIRPECIAESWQTGTSRKTCRLAFNLWNGRICALLLASNQIEVSRIFRNLMQ